MARTRVGNRVARQGSRRRSLVGASIILAASLALPWVASAQEASPPVAASPMAEDRAELIALIPEKVGGAPLASVDWSAVVEAPPDDPESQALAEGLATALAPQGKDLGDMRMAWASWEMVPLSVIAYHVRDADASSLIPAVAASYGAEAVQAELDLDGKTVITVKPGGQDIAAYLYATADVLWEITGEEPYVSELIAELP